ncbi:O13/O129/O135 family O-antigen flippase [Ramlibacter monticola]|uniref:Flippase n=1 Tax=Ramlibacter monticola TaxID=1926872 RepID=A0A936YX37_9BURK|nr:flippase [Ramlibacter monticola]MBL0391070.1 flippase [Ramlibacter monticola]
MLLRNTSWNLLGLGAPLVVAAFAIPALLGQLGQERFGLLALVWGLVSYFGLFDLGLGRAVTQQLARSDPHAPADGDAGRVLGTALVLMLIIGLAAAALIAVFAGPGVALIARLTDRAEAERAVYWMAAAIPFIVLTAGLRGALEARHAFAVVNMIRVPMGVFTYAGPWLVVMAVGPRIDWIAAVLGIGRVVACAVHWYFALHRTGDVRELAWSKALVKPLIGTGGWMSVSNVAGPLMANADRFIIGGLVSAAAVAAYAVPNEIVMKLWVIPGALTAVLLPTFAANGSRADIDLHRLYGDAVRAMFAVLLPICAALALFADELLGWWLSGEMAHQSAPLLRLFAAGMFLNCLATIPYTLLQATGRARTTALIHCVELPVTLVLTWWLTSRHGVTGAAVAWLLRATFDTAAMFWFVRDVLKPGRNPWVAADGWWLLCAAFAWAGLTLQGTDQRVWVWIAVVAFVLLLGLRRMAPRIRRRSLASKGVT